MKPLLFALFLAISSTTFASENELLARLTGKTPSGEVCTYSVYRMNNWEGQIVVFLEGPNGNFRVELNAEHYDQSKFVPQYPEGTQFSYDSGDFVSKVSATEIGDTDKEVRISLSSNNLLKPKMAQGSHLPEFYSCMF